MQTDVVTVRRGTTVGQLMRVLSRHSISGVPVVDENGSPLGVVSAADVMALAEWPEMALAEPWRAEPDGEAPLTLPGERGGYFTTSDGPLWHFPLERLPLAKARVETTPVEEIMTAATFHIRPDATVPELARFLVQLNIHRALVLEGSRLAGIVTSMDALRAVASGAAG
jgi:CBS domain-containing protein